MIKQTFVYVWDIYVCKCYCMVPLILNSWELLRYYATLFLLRLSFKYMIYARWMPVFHHSSISLRWRHNGCDGVSNHQSHDCLLNSLFGRRSKKYQSSASLAFVQGIHRGPVNSPHKWPVTRKMFPFDDFIMINSWLSCIILLDHQIVTLTV